MSVNRRVKITPKFYKRSMCGVPLSFPNFRLKYVIFLSMCHHQPCVLCYFYKLTTSFNRNCKKQQKLVD